MKKMLIFVIIVFVITAVIYGIYNIYSVNLRQAKKENLEYEYYINKELSGLELATLINKVVNNNEKNKVEKNENNFYIQNNENSIIIEIYMTDTEEVYRMERIYNNGIEKFVENYNIINFKIIDIKYHKYTNKVSYILFEQI